MIVRQKNLVTEVPTEEPTQALAHYRAKLAHETDCWDVHATEKLDHRGFVLVDVRSSALYEEGHLPGAIHIPWMNLTEERLAGFDSDTLFVVYCAGPHCNGSVRAAIRIAEFGRPVKELVGGVTGWIDEGYTLVPA